jgi:hypothetical protein
MGLANIQERVRSLNGTAQIESEPGKGTTIHVLIPLLLTPEIKQQQEQDEYEAQRSIARAQGGLQLNGTIATFMLVALITNLGLFVARASIQLEDLFLIILGLGLILMCYGITSAHLAIMSLKHYRDAEDRLIHALSLQVHLGWEVFLRMLLFASWQILLWGLVLLRPAAWWEIGLFFLVLAGSIVTLLGLENGRAKRAQDRYYSLLSRSILRGEIRYRRRSLRLRVILYLCLSITLVLNRSIPFFTPITPWQWLRDYILFTFLVLCIGLMIDIRQLQPWRKLVKVGTKIRVKTAS